MKSRALFSLFLFIGYGSAQFDPRAGASLQIRVHVVFSNGGDCSQPVHLTLRGDLAGTVAEGDTDQSCSALLSGIAPGSYSLAVSGRGFAATESSTVAVAAASPFAEDVEVDVQGPALKGAKEASVSAAELRIPPRAAREFDKAGRLMEKQDWIQARDRLQRAIAIHPGYVQAYNNLGVVYARLGDRAQESEALQKAISIDDRFAPAYVNLARMNMAASHFGEAETQLKKAAELDPKDVPTLVLLTYAAFCRRNFDEAIGSAHKVHATSNIPHADAHWYAALALEQQQRIADAAVELVLFLNEQATGPRADLARKELENIKAYYSVSDSR